MNGDIKKSQSFKKSYICINFTNMFKRLVLVVLLFVSFNSFGQDINELRKKLQIIRIQSLLFSSKKQKIRDLSLVDAEKQLILIGGKAEEIKKLRNLWNKKLPESDSKDVFNGDEIKSQFGEIDGFIKDSLAIEDEELKDLDPIFLKTRTLQNLLNSL